MLMRTLARLLFPSWAFFDTPRELPVLEIRRASTGPDVQAAELDAWMPALQHSPRAWWQLLFNAAGTRDLAAQALVHRMHFELECGEFMSGGVTHRLVDHLVVYLAQPFTRGGARDAHVSDQRVATPAPPYRIVVRDSDATRVVYASDVRVTES